MSEIDATDPENPSRDRLADSVLANAVFDGWGHSAIEAAGRQLALPAGEAERLFPGGTFEVIDWLDRRTTERMVQELAQRDLKALRIRERVALAVRLRLEPLNAHREGLRRAAKLMATPLHARRGAGAVWRTVDAIWHGLGDTSTDYNYYTKRALLAGVYGSTMLVWFDDKSEGCANTWAFLDRRIENVMQIEKLKGQLSKLVDRGRTATRRA
ncbi:MAG: COQ9 family protein [Rhodospirillales bacterium]